MTFAALALAPLPAAMAQAAADPARYMPAELIAQSLAPKPGTMILVGVRMTPRPGWHGYWSNPGDSGIAPSVTWSAPAGIRFGPLLHPAPTLIEAGGISSFVHDGPHILLARMSVGRSVRPGTPIPIEAKLDWAACTATQCVPLHATLRLHLIAGAGREGTDAAALRAAERQLPKAAPEGAFNIDGKTVRLIVPASVRLDPARARFFPDRNEVFATARARAVEDDGRIALAGQASGELPQSISGVVTDGSASYRIAFERRAPAPAAAPAPAPAPRENAALPSQSETRNAPVRAIAPPQPEPAPTVGRRAPAPILRWAAATIVILAAGMLVAWRRSRR